MGDAGTMIPETCWAAGELTALDNNFIPVVTNFPQSCRMKGLTFQLMLYKCQRLSLVSLTPGVLGATCLLVRERPWRGTSQDQCNWHLFDRCPFHASGLERA